MKKNINSTLIILKNCFFILSMKISNLYYSQTGNTEKIARKISLAIKNSGHEITMIEAEKKH